MMKRLPGIGMTLVLCSCGSPGQVHRSFNYNGQSLHSMDLTDPHFYMDDDERASGGATGSPAVPHYTVDPSCASTCQSRGHSADSCSGACGF
jgi:hypothetical protein